MGFHLLDMNLHRCGRMLFRTIICILIFTVAIPAAPCDVMCRKQPRHVNIIDVKYVAITLYTAGLLGIPERHSKAAAFIVDKAIKGDPPFRTEVISKLYRILKFTGMLRTEGFVLIIWDTVHSLVICPVLLFTPGNRLIV